MVCRIMFEEQQRDCQTLCLGPLASCNQCDEKRGSNVGYDGGLNATSNNDLRRPLAL